MGKTYARVVALLEREFTGNRVTKYSFCKKTGINPTSVERYMHGISEPSQASLDKLADYFGVSVAELRGEQCSTQGRGNGKTPARAIELLREAVSNSSQSAVARDTGLTQSAIGRYIKGVGEPTTDTLQRLADYFNETFIIEIRPRGKE